jgi:3-phosphoshikimate 1-carboxyvinyltransferase
MARALYSLGAGLTEHDGDWAVIPATLQGPAAVDVGLAGTVMRFVLPLAGLADGAVHFDGDPRSYERPLGPLIGALRAIGVEIDDAGRSALPLTVHGHGGVAGGPVSIDASGSSQFVSALLLAAPKFDKGIELRHAGGPLPSLPHIAMSVAMLRAAGVDVDDSEPASWRVHPSPIRLGEISVEPDLSNAAPFLAAALVTSGRVRIPYWPAQTTQPGAQLPALLHEMGATTSIDEGGLTVRGGGVIHGLDADLHDVSELAPVLAALCALADGPSRLTGLAHTRGHETDRLAALARELERAGAQVEETEDGLTIRPRPVRAATFASYADHRMAQAGAVLGLAAAGTHVEVFSTTGKTLPDFVGMWNGMLGVPH